jgi:hypothetical protein
MSYQRKPTVLIARQGYSGLSGPETCGPDQQWDPNFVIPGLPPGQCTPKGSTMVAAPSSGIVSTIGSFLGGLFKSSTPAAPVIIAPQSSTPTWLLPVAIGGAGLVAIMLLTKRPQSNPARRRRRHRR